MLGPLSYFSRFNPAITHYVKHDLVCGYEIVGNDASMTLPPYRFGAHYCSRALVPEVPQPLKTRTEFFSHGIIGIIVKTLILPKPIHCGVNVALVSKTAKTP
jgi:hypothetical protein